jgi:hypothetical protein
MTDDIDQLTSRAIPDDAVPSNKNPYLPTHERNEVRAVGVIYFKTGQPEPPSQGFQPSAFNKYLDQTDRQVLEQLLGGSEVIDDGGLMDDKVQQLLRQHWGFIALSDDRGITGGNTALCQRRGDTVIKYLLKTLIEADDTATWTMTEDGYVSLDDKSNFHDEWRYDVALNILLGARYAESVTSGMKRQQDQANPDEAERPLWRAVRIGAQAVEKPVKNVPETCGGYHARDTECWSYDTQQDTVSANPVAVSSLGANEIEAARTPPFSVDDAELALAAAVNVVYETHWKDASESARENDDDLRFEVSRSIHEAIYTFRFNRMVLHEIFRGHWNPRPAPGLRLNSTAAQAAHSLLCWDDYGRPNSHYDLIEQKPFGEVPTSTQNAQYNAALGVYHLHLVRTIPWYRAAFMSEFPGRVPNVSTLQSIFNTIPVTFTGEAVDAPDAAEWVFSPGGDWDSLDPETQEILETSRGDIHWPDAKAEYQSGKDHNRYMKSFGGYEYDQYHFIHTYKNGQHKGKSFDEVHPRTFSSRLRGELANWNNLYPSVDIDTETGRLGPNDTSYLKQLRDAMKRGQELVRREGIHILQNTAGLSTTIQGHHLEAMYQTYIDEYRTPQGLPDYTTDARWEGSTPDGIEWRTPTKPTDAASPKFPN